MDDVHVCFGDPLFFWWHGACVCVLRLRPVLVFGDKRVS
jgi:hypothetical protein